MLFYVDKLYYSEKKIVLEIKNNNILTVVRI